jgi:hypothetical protein
MAVAVKVKKIMINNPEAIRLVRERAKRERRPFAQAAAVTIIERLGGNDDAKSRD